MSDALQRTFALAAVAVLGGLLLAAGCADLGDVLPTTSPGDAAPAISELVPARTFPGDTVMVVGSGFGTTPGRVAFTGQALPAVVHATVVTWESNRIVVLAPAEAGDGPVRVKVGEIVSEPADFAVAPEVSFSNEVAVLFGPMVLGPGRYNCSTCHAFCEPFCDGGLSVLPYDRLMQGTSFNGPVVIPRRSASSLLVQRLLPSTPIPERMPRDGLPSYMTPEEIRTIADWIDQGARDN